MYRYIAVSFLYGECVTLYVFLPDDVFYLVTNSIYLSIKYSAREYPGSLLKEPRLTSSDLSLGFEPMIFNSLILPQY